MQDTQRNTSTDLFTNATSAAKRSCQGGECIPYIVIEGAIAIIAILANVLTILAFYRFKGLRTNTNTIIVSLAAVDLLTGLVGMPYHIVSAYLVTSVDSLHHLSFNKYFCLGKITAFGALNSISFLHQLLIAVERCIKICWSQSYLKLMSTRKVGLGIASLWLYVMLMFCPPFLGWNSWSPGVECRANISMEQFTRYVVSPHIPICLVTAYGCYFGIFRHVRKQKNKLRPYGNAGSNGTGIGRNRPQMESNELPNVPATLHPAAPDAAIAGTSSKTHEYETESLDRKDNTSNKINGETLSSQVGLSQPGDSKGNHGQGSSQIGAADQRIQGEMKRPSPAVAWGEDNTTSRKSAQGNVPNPKLTARIRSKWINQGPTSKMELKVAKMTAITLIWFTTLYLPYPIIIATENHFDIDSVIPNILFNLAIVLISLSSAINPLIYGIMNAKFKAAYLKILKLK